MRWRVFFILLCSTVVFVGPVLWSARNLTFRLDSDYDTVLPILHFIVDSFHTTKIIPLWNPYIGTGVSIIGDPLSLVLNPFILLPIMVFGAEQGLRITIFLVVFFSGLSMWFFLTKLDVAGWLRLWGATLYQTSGALGARLAAGQIQTFLSYPLIPLFFATTLSARMKKINIFSAAFVLTLIIFSGDFYTVLFLSIFFLGIKGYHVIAKQEHWTRALFELFVVYFLFGIFASVKLVPYIFEVLPHTERFSIINPFAGSIPIFFSLLPFVIPFRTVFYDRPFFQRLFGFHFNWYEYYVFISPLPFLFLLKIKELRKHNITVLLIFLICVGALYGSLKFLYSPFYWLFHLVPTIRMFRVPQRIFTPMVPLLIGLLTLCAQKWKGRIAIIICSLSIVWTFFVGQQTMLLSFEQPRIKEATLVHTLRQKDKSSFFVITFSCCMQTFLIDEHIPILNYYYGWKLKGTPNFVAKNGESDFSSLYIIRPKYIIAPNAMNFSSYSYEKLFGDSISTVWYTRLVTL